MSDLPPPPSLPLGKKIAFSLVTTAAVLVGTEGALRAFGFARGVAVADDARTGYRLVPDQDVTTDRGHRFHINALGLRDEDFPRQKPAGEFRVLLLGDSLTYGVGVDQSETFARLLDDRLEERCGDGKVRVMNGAVLGYDTKHERDYLRTYGFDLEPDLVVVMFFHNDIWFNERKTAPSEFPGRDVLRRTATFRTIEQLHRNWVARRMGADGSLDDLKDRQFQQLVKQYTGELPATGQGPDEPINTQVAANILAEMRTECRKRGVRLVVAALPAFHNTEDPELPHVQGALLWHLKKAQVKHTYLIDALRPAHPTCWLDHDPGHLSVEGHRLVAKAMEAWLLDEQLIPCP